MSRKQSTQSNVGSDGEVAGLACRADAGDEKKRRFLKLKAELVRAYAAPEASYEPLTAEDIIRRNEPGREAS